MDNNSFPSVNRRVFLKQAGLSLAFTLVLSHQLVKAFHRLQGNVRLVQTAGPSSPYSVSFENEMADLTLNSYMGQIQNLRSEAYHNRYVTFTVPVETLYFAVNNPSSSLKVEYFKQEEPNNSDAWYVDLLLEAWKMRLRSQWDGRDDAVERLAAACTFTKW